MSLFPNHIALIMDGNRRWAKLRGQHSVFGHKQGIKALKKIISTSVQLKISELSVFAFSTENWKRLPNEVNTLFKLVEYYLKSETAEMNKNNISINFIGSKKNFDLRLTDLINYSEKVTSLNDGLKLNIALDYGGKSDIVNCVKEIANHTKNRNLEISDINENTIEKNLFSSHVKKIDMMIRTGGEKRLSNFMLWQLAYSELFFTDTLWPDFDSTEFIKLIDYYHSRDRRFGSSTISKENI